MVGRVAVFVDAGYFWVQACTAVLGHPGKRTEITIDYPKLSDRLLEVAKKLTAPSELLRVYWYDGPSRDGKGPDHQQIDDLDFFKLRLGTRNMTGQQKAVDGLIIADMLSLTQSRSIDDAVLLSGDADLMPGVTAAQAMGLRVHLVVLEPRNATSPYLAAEADRKHYPGADWMRQFAKAATAIVGATDLQSAHDATGPQPHPEKGSSGCDPVPTFPFDEVAGAALQTIRGGEFSHLLEQNLKGRVRLPQEIDRHLLYQGKKKAGRELSEEEKRGLRAGFKKLL